MNKIRFFIKVYLVLLVIAFNLLAADVLNRAFIGTVYNIFHEEYDSDEAFFDAVDFDMKNIADAGISHVMVFPLGEWNTKTKSIHWTRTDYLIKKIEELGLKFVPVMLKEEQCSHYFPLWKFRETAGLWEQHCQDNGNVNNRQDVDFADPQIFPILEEYFKAVIARYGNSSALSFYNIWNEPHYHSNAPHVIKKFQQWVYKKYGTLEAINRSWGENYTDLSELTPFLNDNWNSSMPQIDWKIFRNELNGELLRQLTVMLRKYDRKHPVNSNPVGTAFAGFGDFGYYTVDNWAMTSHEDICGISYYPDAWEREHGLQEHPQWLHSLTFDIKRSASGEKNYILTELYTNPKNGIMLNGYLDSTDVSLLGWKALAHDCKGIIYWKWKPFLRGRQSFGRGLCTADGTLASRGKGAAELARVVANYGDLIYQAKPVPAKTAIMIDMVGLLKSLEMGGETRTRQFMYMSIAGIYKALNEANISVDFLRTDQPLSAMDLQQYKTIYLPFQIAMRENVSDMLQQYVENGGWLVADCRTAIMDEEDSGYSSTPGAGLQNLFGVAIQDWQGKNGEYQLISNNKLLPDNVAGVYFREKLIVSPKISIHYHLKESKEPAIVMNHFGTGKAIYSSVPLGGSYYLNETSGMNDVIVQFAKMSGVSPDAEFAGKVDANVEIKQHDYDQGQLLYVINAGSEPLKGIIQISSEGQRIAEIFNITRECNAIFKQGENRITFAVELAQKECAVFIIKYMEAK
ncbi:MAG: beta-galactosidase [Candidatus Marinimicrobia bacterium]|nr:beta-galactosidase [Candidatus Neomarinimicrobiota bacterium]